MRCILNNYLAIFTNKKQCDVNNKELMYKRALDGVNEVVKVFKQKRPTETSQVCKELKQ